MSTDITLNSADVATAADFLESFMSNAVPDGDFTKGTALRDLTVQALAAVVAFLRADAALIRQMQSLVSVQAAVGGDPDALKDAVTAILSNFLITPKGGTKARGFAIGHSSQQVDVFISTITKFTFSQGLIFVVDTTDTLFIPAATLVPIIDSTGAILDYEFRIPLVAVATGEGYNIDPGLFTTFDRFNPYVTRVEVSAKFSGGKGSETVTEILARAPTAISVRNLINPRSITATIDDNFDGVESVMVVGMGDPEMQRDIVPTIAPHLAFHIGGAVDIYLRTALVETEFTGTVGDLFERPDQVSVMFRDGSVDFVAAGVETGDILRITAGLPITPAEFLIVEVISSSTLMVSERSSFSVATDEASPPTFVTYTIGRIGPTYNDVVFDTGGIGYTTGLTSRRVQTVGRITLPGGPIMDLLGLAIIDPAAGEASFKSTLDGFVHFPVQVNDTPDKAVVATPDSGLQFQMICHNALFAQSSLGWNEIVVGTFLSPTRFDTYNLRVRYRTLASFGAIDSFVRGARERVSAAFQLPRGHHPVVVSLTLRYSLKATATVLLDNTIIAQTIIDYINNFDASADNINVSAIIQLVMDTYPTIAKITPPSFGAPLLTINYSLRAPTGDVLSYATTDVVDINDADLVAGALPDGITLASLGVTGRTLRYVANATGVTAIQTGLV